jgi:antitoxin YefM
MTVTASEARRNLFPLIEQVNEDHAPVEITSRRGHAVLISLADYESLQETAYLLRAPTNAKRLLEAIRQSLEGKREEHPLST